MAVSLVYDVQTKGEKVTTHHTFKFFDGMTNDRLHHVNDKLFPTGKYCFNICGAAGVLQNI
jgi:hypothetical protein